MRKTSALVIPGVLLMLSSTSQAVPPHAHTLMSITWCDGGAIAPCVADPTKPHQHYDDSPLWDEGTGEGQFDGYSDWDNETFSAQQEKDFNHGFIVENFLPAPDYWFNDKGNADVWTTDAEAKKALPLIKAGFKTWSDLEAGASPTSGLPLITGILFAEAFFQFVAEINIYWGTDAQYDPLKNADGTTNDAVFCQLAGVCPGFPDQSLFFNEDTDWFFGADKTKMGDKQVDLSTVALHEIGHIVGLDHQDDKDDIMYTFAGDGDDVKAGSAFRALSMDDKIGAYSLYSIPVPAPGAALLALIGLGATRAQRRRRRSV